MGNQNRIIFIPMRLKDVLNERKYYVTYNRGRGQGKGLEKEFDQKSFSSTDKPKVFNSYNDAKKYAEKMEKMFQHSIGGGTAYWVSDEKMNPIKESVNESSYRVVGKNKDGEVFKSGVLDNKKAKDLYYKMAKSKSYVTLDVVKESVNEDKVYIDFLNKKKGFKQDRIKFNSYEDAVKWARKNFDKFSPDMIKYESINEVKLNDLVNTRLSIEVGSGKTTGNWSNEELIEKLKEAIKHNLFDREFYYNWTDLGKEYNSIFEKETLSPMIKNIDRTLKEFFVLKGSTLVFRLEGSNAQKWIDKWFQTKKSISNELKSDYYSYRKKYAGVTLTESVNEDKYYVGYNKGRGQGTGVFKDVFSTYKDAKKEVEKIEKQRGGSYNQIAYYVADEKGNFVRETMLGEGRELKSIQSDLNKTIVAIQSEISSYKATKGTPQEKKHVDNLKKLHPIKKKLESELEMAVSGLYKDAELKIED
jgi:hypothetical protein